MSDPVPEPAQSASPTPTAPAMDRHSPSTLQYFERIYRIEMDGGSVIVLKGDNDEYYMEVMSKNQPVIEVHDMDMDNWNEYAMWKRQRQAEMAAKGEVEVQNRCLALENTIVAMQRVCPGRWDNKFVNKNGEPYIEAVVGLNPLANGYSISAPESGEICGDPGNDTGDMIERDESTFSMPERTLSEPEEPERTFTMPERTLSEPEEQEKTLTMPEQTFSEPEEPERTLTMPGRTFSAPEEPETDKKDENKENIDPQSENVLERAEN